MAKITDAEKRANFVRLAEARTDACIQKVRLIGNLASGQYSKTDADVEAIFSTLRGQLDAVEMKFHATKDALPKFKLG